MDLLRNDIPQIISGELASLKELAKLFIESGTGDEVQGELDSIRTLVEKLEKSTAELNSKKELYARVKEKIENNADVDNFKKLMRQESNGSTTDPSTYGYTASFNRHLDEMLADKTADDSIIMSGEPANAEILDPWTKQVIQEPIMCIECRHKYEKRSVESLLRKRSHFKCPYIGCDSYVTASNTQDC